jgi:hypothetical protein
LDGKRAQTIERGDVSVEVLSDRDLFAIIRGGSREPVDGPSHLQLIYDASSKSRTVVK